MEKCVVCGRDSPAQACLFRSLGLTISEMPSLLEQIVWVRHLGAFPECLTKHGLFRFASKIEVSLEPELLRLDFMQDFCDDALGSFSQASGTRRVIGNNDSEEEGDVSLPVFGKAVHNADNVRRQSALCPPDSGPYFLPIDQSALNNRHNAIIAHTADSGIIVEDALSASGKSRIRPTSLRSA